MKLSQAFPQWTRFALGILLQAHVASVHAHPAVGIVQDSRGNVFFTDTKQVWKIGEDGKQSVALPNVHTHELCLDAEDNLYGEHLWYEGDATKKWGHRVWRLKPDGSVSDVIPAREGFLRDYSFVRDRAGNMYWANRGAKTTILKRAPDGTITTHATGNFRAVQQMVATPGGDLYLMDGGDLRRVATNGSVTTLVAKLSAQQPPPASVSDLNYHMGLWLDANTNVYVAVAAEQLVLRVGTDGKPVAAARSPAPWAPSGGMFDRNDNLWLLEYDPKNAVRVRRIASDGSERIFTTAVQ